MIKFIQIASILILSLSNLQASRQESLRSVQEDINIDKENLSFKKATSWKSGQFVEIAEKLKKAYGTLSPISYGVTKNENKNLWVQIIRHKNRIIGTVEHSDDKVIFSFKGVESFFSKDFLLYFLSKSTPIPANKGLLHAGLFSLYKEIYESKNNEISLSKIFHKDMLEKEIIFSGYGFGAGIALYGAFDFSQKFKTTKNQIKVVNFSSPKICDKEFAENFYRTLGQENIIQFINYLDVTQTLPFKYVTVGLPIYLLPSEQLRDTFYDGGRFAVFMMRTMIAGYFLASKYNNSFDFSIYDINNMLHTSKISLLMLTLLTTSVPIIPSDYTIISAVDEVFRALEDMKSKEGNSLSSPVLSQIGHTSPFSIKRSVIFRKIYEWLS